MKREMQLLLKNKKLRDVNPTECGEEYCASDFRRGPTSRQYYLLHYVFSGEGIYEANGEKYTVTSDHMFIIHPHEMVSYYVNPNNPWHYEWVAFELSINIPLLKENYILNLPQARNIFNSLRKAKSKEGNRELYICGKIYELLSLLLISDSSLQSDTQRYVETGRQYMESNFMKPITVNDVSNRMNINRSYFSTIFKKHIGKSPQQYLIDLRLENAASLIKNHAYSATDAASSSGYGDIFNFSKMFKAKFGVPPTEYAKKT